MNSPNQPPLPSMPPSGVNINIKILQHNIVYRCPICEEWFSQAENPGTAVSMVQGFQMSPQGGQMAMALVLICSECFVEHKLTETPDPQIHVAMGPLPK